MLEMLPYMELMLLIIGLVSKKTAGVSNCRTSFSNKDHVLIGHVIRTLKNKAFESCTFSCELEPQCFSVNYIASRRTCELNNVAKDYFPGDLVARKGAFYMDMVIRKYHPCASLRCENGGTCISSPSLKCKCVKGFSGVRCENLQAMGMESGAIDDKNIDASSAKVGYDAWRGRLNKHSCWMPTQNRKTEFIRVTFPSTKTIFAIATQGAPNSSCWVKSYTLQTFDGSSLFTDPKEYQANVDNISTVTNKLTTPINANWLRISPQSWASCIAIRLEVYGY